MSKLIRYRISISKVFPAYHTRKDEPTNFFISIMDGIENKHSGKIHTIRGNYGLWKKRFDKINQGQAVLELYQWSGEPYRSKCETKYVLTNEDGIGVEKIIFHKDRDGVAKLDWSLINNKYEPNIKLLAKNDGLLLKDFRAWFKPYDLNEPLAIIHFTNFRYANT